MNLSYNEFKQLIIDNDIPFFETSTGSNYQLLSIVSGAVFRTSIAKTNPANNDQDDYETYYQNDASSSLDINRYTTDKRLKVDVKGDTINLTALSAISKYLKGDFNETDISLTSNYQTIYTYSGQGKLFSFINDYNSDRVKVKLTIDDQVVFELTLQEVDSLQSYSGGGCDDNGQTHLNYFLSRTSGNKLRFHPPNPVEFKSLVKIEAKKTSGSNKKLERRIVWLTKEPSE
jgi:hypothetical protein